MSYICILKIKDMIDIFTLEDSIREANAAYRTGDTLDISELSQEIQTLLEKTEGSLSDKDYDFLVKTAEKLGSKISQSGVIENVNDLGISERKQKLDYPMYSLNKEQSVAELKKWAKNKGLSTNVVLIITGKYDGVSVLKNEQTTKSFSRGDGIFGQDITPHLKNINPKFTRRTNLTKNENVASVEIYTIGELIIPKFIWEKYGDIFVRDNGEKYKNPRNMVAGLVNNDDVSPYWKYVDHVRYGVADEEYRYNKTEQLGLIEKETGFKVPHEIFTLSEITNEKLDELYYKWGEVYEIDGLVIDIEDKNIRKNLGRETNNNPAYARAYKANWSTPTATPVLFNDWDVSKEGYVKPVVNIEPFDTEGVTVSRATGYNAKFIKDNKIGKGTIVEIIRSGSVIPKIVNVPSPTQADIPTHCPSCGTVLTWNKSGVEIMCTNTKCETKNIKKISFFFSSLDVEDFGESIVTKFYRNGYDTVGKILDMRITDIAIMDGMGTSSGNKILSQFEKIRNAKFEKLGHASGSFENLGSRKLKMIVDGLGGMDEFEKFKETYFEIGIKQSLVCELEMIKGVAETTAISFMKGLNKFDKFCREMNIEVKKIEKIETDNGVSFIGRIFVFSGVRDKELKEFIIKNGGDVKTGVSKNTTDMLVKDANSTSAKVTKARNL